MDDATDCIDFGTGASHVEPCLGLFKHVVGLSLGVARAKANSEMFRALAVEGRYVALEMVHTSRDITTEWLRNRQSEKNFACEIRHSSALTDYLGEVSVLSVKINTW